MNQNQHQEVRSRLQLALERYQRAGGAGLPELGALLSEVVGAIVSQAPASGSAPTPSPGANPFGVDFSRSVVSRPAQAELRSPWEALGRGASLLVDVIASWEDAARIEGLSRRADELAASLQPLIAQRVGTLGERVTACREEASRLRNLSSELAGLEREVDQLRQQSASATARVQQLRGERDGLARSSQDDLAEARRLDDELRGMRERLHRLDSSRQELTALESTIGERETELASLDSRRKELQDQVDGITERLDATSRLVRGLEQRAQDPAVQRVREIWAQLPQDAFDRIA